MEQALSLELTDVALAGDLVLPETAHGLVIFVHGSGSSRRSSRNRFVAAALNQRGLGTLLFDLLTEREDQRYENRFDIERLSRRLSEVTQWVNEELVDAPPLAYFGASTGAAAALNAAAELPDLIYAVVSRGGRPDLALPRLSQVRAPTLLLVGSNDQPVIELNRKAQRELRGATKELVIVPGASHLFEEPGTLEQVASLAGDWLLQFATLSQHRAPPDPALARKRPHA